MFFGILFALIAVACVIGLFVKKNVSAPLEVEEEKNEVNDTIIPLTAEDFDKYFNRTAGRYCDHCGIHGSHHTDRHNDYASLVLSKLDSPSDVS